MSDGIYETVPVVPGWSAGSSAYHTGGSKAQPIPSKKAVDAYVSTQATLRQQDDVVARPPLPPPRSRSSNSESEISCSPKHASGVALALSRGKSVKGATPDRLPATAAPIRKSPSASSVETTELSLGSFVDKYASSFPRRVSVTKGFYGVSDQTAITTGDHYNFHFLKQTTVVVATDAKGMEYSIPVQSSLSLALLYDPTNNLEEARKGTVFDTVGDLLNAKVPPRVLAASRAYNGGSQESSLETNEIIVFLGAASAPGGKGAGPKGKRQVRVHSVTHNVPKMLPESCAGCFTTSPKMTGAPLHRLGLQREWLPVKAVVCPGDNIEEVGGDGAESASVLLELNHASLTLASLREETTIVATGAAGDPSEVLEVIELPRDLNIEVELLPISSMEMEGLVTNTLNRYDSFMPTSVIHYTNKPTPKLYDIQCALYKTMVGGRDSFQGMLVKPSVMTLGPRRGSMADKTDVDTKHPPLYGSSVGMSCDTPESYGSLRDQRSNMVTSDVPKRLDTYPSPDSSVQGIKGSEFSKLPEAYASVYDRRSNVVSGEGSKKMEPLPLGTSSTIPEHFQEYVTMTPTGEPGTPEGVALANLLRRINQLEESRKENERITQEKILNITKELGAVQEQLSRLQDSSEEAKETYSQLQLDVNRIKDRAESQYSTTYHPGPRPNGKINGHFAYGTSPPTISESSFPPDPKADERNREYLMSLDVDKVLRLLDCMSLTQYQEAFHKEQITGEILAECDETMLQNDLCVTSKLHRMRLIKVISGRHSAKSLLDGGDPYAGRFVSSRS